MSETMDEQRRTGRVPAGGLGARWGCVGAVLAIGLVLAATAGCGSTMHVDNSTGAPQEINREEPLIAQAKAEVSDLPVPMGFSLRDGNSTALSVGAGRYISHYYRGREGKDRIARFYREQMQANHKWRLDFILKSKGVWRLHFAKGSERCSVTISEDWLGQTTIHGEIYPISSPG